MAISIKSLHSESGFSSPGFNVDVYGNVNITGAFKINGASIATGASLPSTTVYSSLVRVGTLTQLTVNGNTVLSNGTVTVSSVGQTSITSGLLGSLDNITIGQNTAAAATFTSVTADSLTATSLTAITASATDLTATDLTAVNLSNTGTLSVAPTTVGTIDHVNVGNTTPGTGKFTTLTVTSDPLHNTDATTKKYVDTRSLAMSIALGS